MKKVFWLSFIPGFALHSYCQDTISQKNLDEVFIYSNKFPEKRKNIVQKIDVVTGQRIAQINTQNTGDLMINTGNIFVQKSQQGGGSPVIRGFEASRVLLVVDGVRMNNAIYRAGHLQNIITIDNMVLDRLEVLYGPSSTLYGSDALGGVVNLYTKNPQLSKTRKTEIKGNATVRYATANREVRGNITMNSGGKQWASLTSVTYGSFGDMEQGAQRMDKYPDFGKKLFKVERFGSTDSVTANANPDKQVPSGYKQFDVTQKILYQPASNISH